MTHEFDLAAIAHDVSNAIQVALSRLDLALAEPDRSKRFEHLEKCRAAILQAGLTDRTLLTKLRKIERCDLNVVARSMVAFCGEDLPGNIHISVALDSHPLWVLIRDDVLHQALLHLILNARDAMPSGGDIILTTRIEGEGLLGVAAIEVGDSGTGMTAETIAKIWDPWFTTKGTKGTGIGMPLVRDIVQRHRGSVRIQSVIGVGTRVELLFPLTDGE